MSNPKLSPSDAIVIFADLQSDIVSLPLTIDEGALRRAAGGLATLAELFEVPTLVTAIPEREGGELRIISEVADTRSNFLTLPRTTPDSFDNESIRDVIASLGRSTLVVSGVCTEIAVQWLVLSGLANGYKVHVVTDACGGLSSRTEQASLARFTAAGAVLTSVAALAGEVAGDITRSPGKDAVDVVYKMIRG